jgi:methyltransferase-like protein
MKQILKRFKYNRPAIFTHFRIVQLKKNKGVPEYLYTTKITKFIKKLFRKYNKLIINKKFETKKIKQVTRPLVSHFFKKVTALMKLFQMQN